MSSFQPATDRVLLTNDGGIDAPDLAVAEEAAATLARDMWGVAPEHDQMLNDCKPAYWYHMTFWRGSCCSLLLL